MTAAKRDKWGALKGNIKYSGWRFGRPVTIKKNVHIPNDGKTLIAVKCGRYHLRLKVLPGIVYDLYPGSVVLYGPFSVDTFGDLIKLRLNEVRHVHIHPVTPKP